MHFAVLGCDSHTELLREIKFLIFKMATSMKNEGYESYDTCPKMKD